LLIVSCASTVIREEVPVLAKIRLVCLDVDGTLTDGRLLYGPDGVSQSYSARDGEGIMKLLRAGYEVALVSLRDFPATRRRAADLGIRHLALGCTRKDDAVKTLCSFLGISPAETLFMGDDAGDIPALEMAGVAACPSNAAPEVLRVCSLVTLAHGGSGAVREVAERILEARP
jgi:3-deoxy-D-manno-octulosonate 8-phosphate phosphatase (KDO 8-P phosphatase)